MSERSPGAEGEASQAEGLYYGVQSAAGLHIISRFIRVWTTVGTGLRSVNIPACSPQRGILEKENPMPDRQRRIAVAVSLSALVLLVLVQILSWREHGRLNSGAFLLLILVMGPLLPRGRSGRS